MTLNYKNCFLVSFFLLGSVQFATAPFIKIKKLDNKRKIIVLVIHIFLFLSCNSNDLLTHFLMYWNTTPLVHCHRDIHFVESYSFYNTLQISFKNIGFLDRYVILFYFLSFSLFLRLFLMFLSLIHLSFL